MTSVAANIVTTASGAGAGAGAGNGANAPGGGDGFAAMLGGVMQGDVKPGNDKATVAKPSDGDTDAAPDAATAAVQAALAAQALLPIQEDTASCQPVASQPSGDDDASDATAASDTSPARSRGGVAADPAQIPSGGADGANADPNLAQLLAMLQPQQAASAPSATADTPAAGAPADAAKAAPADPAQLAAASASDAAASAILTGGAATKAAKPGDDKKASDSEKSQSQGSTAAALADTAASRVFTDSRVSSAHALPIHTAADQSKGNSPSGGQQDNPGHSNTLSPAPVAPAAAAAETPAANAATPATVQTAPQPDAVSAANAAGSATPATPPAQAAPAVAAQLQISHPASATALPDLNSLAFNIAAKSEGGARHFDIRLDPAELGRVDVRLTVDDAGKAQASLSVEKPQTLELLQKDQGHLERALKDAGLDLTQNGLNFSLKGQQQNAGGGGERAHSSRGRNLTARAIAAVDSAASITSMGSVSPGDTRLDIRV